MNTISSFSWQEIKEQIKALNPTLYSILNRIGPAEDIPFYVAQYRFGERWYHQSKLYLPDAKGELIALNDDINSNNIPLDLDYCRNTLPCGLVISKYQEWHYQDNDGRLYPEHLIGPGALFNTEIFLNQLNDERHNLSVSSGALSSFLLPSIGCKTKHDRLQREFSLTTEAPKSPYEHHIVFKELLQKDRANSAWHSKILLFSETFIRAVQHNPDWIALKLYFSQQLNEQLIKKSQHMKSYELFYGAKKINRFKPSPYIIDTAKYIFKIGFQSGLGLKPTDNEDYFPVNDIQTIYETYYGLNYTPTVMVPSTLDTNESVYYPLQCPLVNIRTFKTNRCTSALGQLELLKNVILAFQAEFSAETSESFGSSLYYASKETTFSFYHYQSSHHLGINNSVELIQQDKRFSHSNSSDSLAFASDAKLFRGCVKLNRLQEN